MRFHAPERPRAGLTGRPMYLSEGKPVVVLPQLHIEPSSKGGWNLSTWLMIERNGAVTHRTWAKDLHELGQFLSMWEENPEVFMRDHLGWQGYRSAGPVQGVPSGSAVEDFKFD